MCAKNIIITNPARNTTPFDAFDFYNLVGRTGRLYQHYLGTAYYIKSDVNREYDKKMAIKKIKFEMTDDSQDFDFHTKEDSEASDYIEFLSKLNITAIEYKENIGSRYKINRINILYNNYLKYKDKLILELNDLGIKPEKGRGKLINILHIIIKENEKSKNFNLNLEATIINKLINKNRLKIKTIINSILTIPFYSNLQIDHLISTIMRLKSSYIENEFYSMCKIICFFLKNDGISQNLIDNINSQIISCIDYLYFSDSKCKKVLKELGLYEYDIDKIIKIIGNDTEDVQEIIQLLKNNKFENITYISQYIIKRLND